VNDTNAYVADDAEIEENFELVVNERQVSWDDSASEIEASEDATVTGTTTVAPGTELATEIDSPVDEGSFIETKDVVVQEGTAGSHTFAATYDLSEQEAGLTADLLVQDPNWPNDVSNEIETTTVAAEEEAEAAIDVTG